MSQDDQLITELVKKGIELNSDAKYRQLKLKQLKKSTYNLFILKLYVFLVFIEYNII